MSAIDTPDNQRGVVSPQLLLAAVPAGTDSTTIGVPPNCETLVITSDANDGAVPSVQGATTSITYPGARGVVSFETAGFSPVWLFDVSDVIDAELNIQWFPAPSKTWYVYSDAGVHTIADISNNRDGNGSLYTVPTVPYGEPGSHPPQELSVVGNGGAASFTLLAAPGAGVRYRVFGGNMASLAAGLYGYLKDSVSGTAFFVCVGEGNASLVLPSQGLALSTDAAVDYVLGAGAGTMAMSLSYTTETA